MNLGTGCPLRRIHCGSLWETVILRYYLSKEMWDLDVVINHTVVSQHKTSFTTHFIAKCYVFQSKKGMKRDKMTSFYPLEIRKVNSLKFDFMLTKMHCIFHKWFYCEWFMCAGTSKKKKKNMVKKYVFSCNLFQKVKCSYILDSLM